MKVCVLEYFIKLQNSKLNINLALKINSAFSATITSHKTFCKEISPSKGHFVQLKDYTMLR